MSSELDDLVNKAMIRKKELALLALTKEEKIEAAWQTTLDNCGRDIAADIVTGIEKAADDGKREFKTYYHINKRTGLVWFYKDFHYKRGTDYMHKIIEKRIRKALPQCLQEISIKPFKYDCWDAHLRVIELLINF